MRKFSIHILLFFSVLILAIVALLGYRIFQTNRISWKLPKEKHILFIGSSHIARGINDALYPGSFNLASPSERYLFTYLKLNKLIENNPQIDTIFLQFAPTDIWEHTDAKYYSSNQMSHFVPTYFPFFQKEEWALFFKINWKDVLSLILQKLPKNIPDDIHAFGGFTPFDQSFSGNEPKSSKPEWTKSGHTINYSYLKKIEEVCKKNHIMLYYLYMPVVNAESFYDLDYYYKTYRSAFSDVELLDYSNWECPDAYRADDNHLNGTGAMHFTAYLLREIHNKANDHTKGHMQRRTL